MIPALSRRVFFLSLAASAATAGRLPIGFPTGLVAPELDQRDMLIEMNVFDFVKGLRGPLENSLASTQLVSRVRMRVSANEAHYLRLGDMVKIHDGSGPQAAEIIAMEPADS